VGQSRNRNLKFSTKVAKRASSEVRNWDRFHHTSGALSKRPTRQGARRSISGGVLLYVDAQSTARNEVDRDQRALGALPRASDPFEPLQRPTAKYPEDAEGNGTGEHLLYEKQLVRFPE